MRIVGWRTRLNRYLRDTQGRPFAWGENDCVTRARGAVRAVTGTDPAPEYEGQYHDEASARAALRRLGHGSLVRILRVKFGRPVCGGQARAGDIAYLPDRERPDRVGALGIVTGPLTAFLCDDAAAYYWARTNQLTIVFRVD